MQASIINMTTWLTMDTRRIKFILIGVATVTMLLGIGAGFEDVLAGKATGGPH
jgi:hypothetical protein